MKQGEIWVVNFGDNNVGHEYKKDRPALIIQSNDQLKITNIFTIIPLTSNRNNRHSDDIAVGKDDTNRLYADSVLKVHHTQSFDKLRFIKKIGIIENDLLDQVKNYLKRHFGIE